ncbi:hypothetical protein LOTGIDRAFT_222671 [Lottia gigantea]|uniref:Phospholipase n=1 Tax=Lottia gigantea TaxID=225164 RepID=V3ZH13_LOTGI|nr:hypothetical protein LOTGIDRAFT_222671 [Lottia gigantea]ESO83442.1 hypothetical protein LOTGIDRAFT_222671 [Lottia gigantea]
MKNVPIQVCNFVNRYTINVKHGEFTWIVKKRYKHFLQLFEHLSIFRAKQSFPLPSKDHRERRKTLNKEKMSVKFPKRPEALVSEDSIPQRMKQLEKYLQSLLKIKLYRNHTQTIEFLEVSHLSFIKALGNTKEKECMVKKCSGGRRILTCWGCVRNLSLFSRWNKRWLVLKDTFLAYIRPEDGYVRDVLLMDSHFNVECGSNATGSQDGVSIGNLQRNLIVKCWTARKAQEFTERIRIKGQTTASDFTKKNRFKAFAPMRENSYAHWFVDAGSYFEAVAESLEKAREEIFITDWWLSPEIYLKRPMTEGDKWRLDVILKRKADAGVKIYIMLYKEVTVALNIDSAYSKYKLLGLNSENIRVIRHPDHLPGDVLLWAHHEKMVVIDQRVAFLGGIDLCYGRWDDSQHRLTDLGYIITRRNSVIDLPQISMSNKVCLHLDTSKAGNLKHNYKNSEQDNDDHIDSIGENGGTGKQTQKTQNSSKLTDISAVARTASMLDSEQAIDEQGLKVSTKLWIGKDYVNFIFKDLVQLDAPFTDFIDRKTMPRMPWHDIGAVVYGKAARDVARHFITRWNFTKTKKFKEKTNYPLLMPRNYSRCSVPTSIKTVTYDVKTQILRSSCSWSAGLAEIEASIHTAYIHCIENAKHYIYIENQFFVTQIDDGNNSQNVVLNGIGDALYRRIIRAHRCQDEFRVYVVMPLLPAFEGEFGTAGGTNLQAVTNWNYASICRGQYSLIEKLSQEVPDPLKYVVFCGLRKHAELSGKMMTELIYVHSKLMIVDDDTVIIGSANINDRSMLGKRDSELAVIVEDNQKTGVQINGKEHMVGKFASSIRTTLFREHLGLDSDDLDITDIVHDDFYKGVWIKQAVVNTTIYDKVFNCIPCDFVHTFQQLRDYTNSPSLSESNPSEAREKLKGVKGHLVLLPRDFLKSENLAPAIGTKEALLPSTLYT